MTSIYAPSQSAASTAQTYIPSLLGSTVEGDAIEDWGQVDSSILTIDGSHWGEQHYQHTRELEDNRDMVVNVSARELIKLYLAGIPIDGLHLYQQIVRSPNDTVWKIWFEIDQGGQAGHTNQTTASVGDIHMHINTSSQADIRQHLDKLFRTENRQGIESLQSGSMFELDLFDYGWRFPLMSISDTGVGYEILVRLNKVKLEKPNQKVYLTVQFWFWRSQQTGQ